MVYEPDAILSEESLTTSRAEYRMRVRVALRAWWTLADMRALFNVRRHGAVLPAAVLAQGAALPGIRGIADSVRRGFALADVRCGATAATFVAGSLFLLLAAAGHVLERRGRSSRFVSLPYYFVLINAAAAHALVSFLRGRRQIGLDDPDSVEANMTDIVAGSDWRATSLDSEEAGTDPPGAGAADPVRCGLPGSGIAEPAELCLSIGTELSS